MLIIMKICTSLDNGLVTYNLKCRSVHLSLPPVYQCSPREIRKPMKQTWNGVLQARHGCDIENTKREEAHVHLHAIELYEHHVQLLKRISQTSCKQMRYSETI